MSLLALLSRDAARLRLRRKARQVCACASAHRADGGERELVGQPSLSPPQVAAGTPGSLALKAG